MDLACAAAGGCGALYFAADAEKHRFAVILADDLEADAARLGIAAGEEIVVGNTRGSVHLTAALFEGIVPGVVIAESIWPNAAHKYGRGINTITGADAPAPFGGAAFHDNKVWIRKA